jgi:hypothetical protein
VKRDFEAGRWIVELRPQGAARFFAAGFLGFWLMGWAVGEGFALRMLLGLLGLWPGRTVGPSAHEAAGTAVLGFLLFWLTFWTLGGVMALIQMMWLLWGVDRIEYDGAGVRHMMRLGPFGRSRWHPRETVRSVVLRGHRTSLGLETSRGVTTLTRLGSEAERLELRGEIEKMLGLRDAELIAELPPGWESEPTPEGTTLLRRSRALRKRQSQVLWTITMLLAGGVAWSLLGTWDDPARWAGVGVGVMLGVLSLAGALWLTFRVDEIHLRVGQAERRQRFGRWARTSTFVPAHLAIERTVDSDGDERYALVLRGAGATSCVWQTFQDPADLIRLGRWMAERLHSRLDLPTELAPSQAA